MMFEFERTLEALYEEFLHLRLDAKHCPRKIKAIHAWVKEK